MTHQVIRKHYSEWEKKTLKLESNLPEFAAERFIEVLFKASFLVHQKLNNFF